MPGIKEVSIHRSAKLPSLGAEQPIINRQSTDAIKQINKQIRVLQDRLQRLEESKAETFKYMKGTLSNDRTVPNKMGEVVFKSSNQTVDARIYDNIVDLKIKNITNAMCLTPDELSQLCNIDSVTISNAQWGYLGAMDQGVAVVDSPTFAKVTASTFESTVAMGTSPYECVSTKLNTNLNADLVDGYHHDQSLIIAANPTFAELYIGSACGIASKLHISGSGYQRMAISSDNNAAYFALSRATTSYNALVQYWLNDLTIPWSHGQYGGTTDFEFKSGALSIIRMKTSGEIGIGVSPSTTYQEFIKQTKTNTTGATLRAEHYQTINVNSVVQGYGLSFFSESDIDNGVTNSGSLFGLFGSALHNSQGEYIANGGTIGGRIVFGSRTGAGDSANACGIRLEGYKQEDIGTFCDIDIVSPVGAGSVTNEWCIYSDHAAPNRFVEDTYYDAANIGVVFGSAQASKISDDNSDMIFDCDVNADTGREFQFQNGFLRTENSDYRRYYHLPLAAFNPGASGATWVDPDANTLGGFQLDNVGEILFSKVDVHNDWDGTSDLTIELFFEVNIDNSGGNVGDTVDIKMVSYYKGIGENSNKTQTVEVATVVDQSPQYKQYKAEFIIDYDLGGNVVESGDQITVCLNLETDTSEVDNIIINSSSYYYNKNHVGIESGDV